MKHPASLLSRYLILALLLPLPSVSHSLALPVGNQLLGRPSRLIGSVISGYQLQQTPFTAASPPLGVSLSPSLYLHNSHPIRSRIAFHRSKFHSGLSFPLNIASITLNEENESYVIICGCKFRRFSQLHNDLIR